MQAWLSLDVPLTISAMSGFVGACAKVEGTARETPHSKTMNGSRRSVHFIWLPVSASTLCRPPHGFKAEAMSQH
jgi:hypothetical protein